MRLGRFKRGALFATLSCILALFCSGCDPARKDLDRARAESSQRGLRAFIATHPRSRLTVLAEAALDSLRFPLKDEGLPYLEAMEDSLDTCRCEPPGAPVRQYHALRETRVSRQVLDHTFHWHPSGRIYHPMGSNAFSGMMIDSLGEVYFGRLCYGDLMIAGAHRWSGGDLRLLPGTILSHHIPEQSEPR